MYVGVWVCGCVGVWVCVCGMWYVVCMCMCGVWSLVSDLCVGKEEGGKTRLSHVGVYGRGKNRMGTTRECNGFEGEEKEGVAQ